MSEWLEERASSVAGQTACTLRRSAHTKRTATQVNEVKAKERRIAITLYSYV